MPTRNLVLEIPGLSGYRRRAFDNLDRARLAARKLANETGRPVEIWFVHRYSAGRRLIATIPPMRERDLDVAQDVDLAHAIGLEF